MIVHVLPFWIRITVRITQFYNPSWVDLGIYESSLNRFFSSCFTSESHLADVLPISVTQEGCRESLMFWDTWSPLAASLKNIKDLYTVCSEVFGHYYSCYLIHNWILSSVKAGTMLYKLFVWLCSYGAFSTVWAQNWCLKNYLWVQALDYMNYFTAMVCF